MSTNIENKEVLELPDEDQELTRRKMEIANHVIVGIMCGASDDQIMKVCREKTEDLIQYRKALIKEAEESES